MTRAIAIAVASAVACGKPPPRKAEGEGAPPPPAPAAVDAAVTGPPADAAPAADAPAVVDGGPPTFQADRYPAEVQAAMGGLDGEHPQDWGPGVKWLIDHPDQARPALRAYLASRPGIMGGVRALIAVREIGHPDDVPYLVAGVHEQPELRDDYITALEGHRHEAAFQALLALAADPVPEIVQGAIGALATRKDERGRAAIERALDHDSADVRASAAWSLNRMGPRPSRAALRRRLAIETDRDVRDELRRALGKK